MKSTGIVRRVDKLGRVVIPKELRKTLMISEGQPIEIFTSDKLIVLRKYETSILHKRKREVIDDLKKINKLSNRKAIETINDAIRLLERIDNE